MTRVLISSVQMGDKLYLTTVQTGSPTLGAKHTTFAEKKVVPSFTDDEETRQLCSCQVLTARNFSVGAEQGVHSSTM